MTANREIHLTRVNRMVAATGPGRTPLPRDAGVWLEERLTYYERKFNFESSAESGDRFDVEVRRLYARHPTTGQFLFPLGLRPRVAAGLADAGYAVKYFARPLAEPGSPAAALDWDGLLADFTIYPGQDVCLSRVVAADGGVITATTGYGKSVLMRMLCRLYHKAKIHVTTKSADLAADIRDDLERTVPGVGFVGSGKKKFGRVTVFVADSLHHGLGDCDVLLADECFTGDTEILVPGGSMRIDNVRPGDRIYSAIGYDVVESVYSKPSTDLYRVAFDDGAYFECTGDHPVFTGRGWVRASGLVAGDVAYGPEAVRLLWEGIPAVSVYRPETEIGNGFGAVPLGMGAPEDLLAILREEAREPDEQSSGADEGEGKAQADTAQADQTRRERAVAALTAAGLTARARGRVGVGSDREDGPKSRVGVPDVVQAGYCQPDQEGRHRDRRSHTSIAVSQGQGREEGQFPHFARVVSVTHLERRSPTPVFNLRVRNHPSYFAGGKLVHNCHELVAPSYAHALGRYTKARMFGFTATPTGRLDGRDVELEAIFGPVLYTVSYQEAQAAGRVVPITVEWLKADRGPAVGHIENLAVREKVGIWTNQYRNRLIADRVRRFDPDEQVMVMVKTIDHAVRLKALLPEFTLVYAAKGMDADRIRGYVRQGLLPADEPEMTHQRLRTLRSEFASGKLKKVISNYVWSTGKNFPELAVLVRADAAASEVKAGQIPGRICRRVAGVKESALLVDCWDQWDPSFLNRSRDRRAKYTKRGWVHVFSDQNAQAAPPASTPVAAASELEPDRDAVQ